MENRYMRISTLASLFAMFILSPIYANNEALVNALKSLGFEFSNGEIVVNEKVLNTKELDFSGKSISDFTGLNAFSNLEKLVLDNSDYPILGNDLLNNIKQSNSNIKSVSFRSCNINSLDLGAANGFKNLYFDGTNKFTTISNFGKDTSVFEYISFPESAKWNYKEILDYYLANTEAAIEIEIDGKLQKYTQYRKVPNDKFRAFLIGKYPDLFDKDEILDLTKEPKFNSSPSLTEMDWFTSSYNFMYFDASGMGDMDGYQFFKNRAIRRWWIYNAEFESLDMSGDKVLQELVIGTNQETDDILSEKSQNENVKRLNLEGCENMYLLQTDGAIEEINIKGCNSIVYYVNGRSIKNIDLSDCYNIEVFFNSTSMEKKTEPSALETIILPTKYTGRGLSTFDISNSNINNIDFTQIKPSEVDGVIIAAERCPNLKYARYNNKLHSMSSFNYGFFEEIDLRGALMKDRNGEWVPAEENEEFYGKNNPYLVILNGKEYVTDKDPEYVKELEVDASSWDKWTYLQFNEYSGLLEIVDQDSYENDAMWKDIADWDFALHAFDLRTNSGESGNYEGGVYECNEVKWDYTKSDLDGFNYTEDKMGEKNLVVDITNMPPTLVSASKSPIEVFENLGQGKVRAYNKVFIIRLASNRGYAIVRFAKYYDGKVKIKYTVLNNENSGINETLSDNAEISEIYTIDGMRVNDFVKGINVIKLADGTVKKVMIK